MTNSLDILIVGAGIGGLTTALCLARHQHRVTILEQASEISEVGAGIQISPNAMKVFRAIGLANALIEKAFQPKALEMRFGRSGRQIFSIPIDDKAEKRWGDLYLHIHRADLIQVLLNAVEPVPNITFQLDSRLRSYEETSGHVSAETEKGTSFKGDLLIGADGIHSVVRTQLLGTAKPDFTGNVAWRAVVPTAELGHNAPPPTACVWAGPQRHAVTYRLRGGTLSNLVGVVERDDWKEESWIQKGSRDDALADFAGWDPVITTLLRRASAHHRWALFDRPPLSKWHSNRVVLIGDACHPTLPFMAQGAAMAIEDGYVLARELSRSTSSNTETVSLERALSVFFETRIARTTSIQKGSRRNMGRFHKSSRTQQLMTYGPMWLAGQIAPDIIRRVQDPIYAFDVTKA